METRVDEGWLTRFRKRKFAEIYDRVMVGYERWIRKRREALAASLPAELVEIGPGTGANLPFLAAGTRWVGVEPNRFFHEALLARAAEHGVEAEVHEAGAEATGLPDACTDLVLSTLVLCSVPDLDGAAFELRRILRPGGRLVFLEHVAAPRWRPLWLLQVLVTPLHSFLADGCRPAPDTLAALVRAGFVIEEREDFAAPFPDFPPWIRPHVMGVARAPA